jgi:hypothetical protein
MKEFNDWFNDGNAVQIGVDQYVEQTTQYSKVFSLIELIEFFKKEYNLQD